VLSSVLWLAHGLEGKLPNVLVLEHQELKLEPGGPVQQYPRERTNNERGATDVSAVGMNGYHVPLRNLASVRNARVRIGIGPVATKGKANEHCNVDCMDATQGRIERMTSTVSR